MKKLNLLCLSLTSLFLVSGNIQAAEIYFGQDLGWINNDDATNSDTAHEAFVSNLTGVGTESFESYARGDTAPLSVDFGIAGIATLSGGGEIETTYVGQGNGRIAYSGTQFWETSSNSFTISFSAPIAALGFYGVDFGDFDGQISATLGGHNTATYEIPHLTGGDVADNLNGSLLYWGIIETETFDSITFSNTGSSADYFGFDDFTIGSLEQVTPVPVPAAVWLFGSALFGLVGFSRKRSKA